MFAGETGPGALAATARTVLKVQREFVSQTGRAVTAPTRGSGLWLKFRVTMEGWSRCHCPNSRTQSTASIAPLIVRNNLGGKTESQRRLERVRPLSYLPAHETLQKRRQCDEVAVSSSEEPCGFGGEDGGLAECGCPRGLTRPRS